jgi:hypothetical protein
LNGSLVGLGLFAYIPKYFIAVNKSHDEEVAISASLQSEEKCGLVLILSQRNQQAQSSDFNLVDHALKWHVTRAQWM